MTPISIRVITAPGTNASNIGERYGAYDGVAWRNSVDCCDSDGNGRVFLDCQDDAVADFISEAMDDDEDIVSYGSI